MSLQALQPPEAAVAALRSSIGAHLSRTSETDPSSYKPIKQAPVYVIDQAEPVLVDDLDHLKPAAWRFVLFRNPREYATGDVTATKDTYKLSMVTTNQARAEELLARINRAENALQDRAAPDRFELRILEAPAFHVRAVWLHDRAASVSDSDLFSVVRGQGPHRRDRLVSLNKFIKLLNRAQSAAVKNL